MGRLNNRQSLLSRLRRKNKRRQRSIDHHARSM
jgi:hypothetical protein